jgi:lipoprotein-anchoring transpeptidase ErfK/SrfK
MERGKGSSKGTALQFSWLAAVLAGLLAVATPVTARMAGDRAAASAYRTREPVRVQVSPAAPKSAPHTRVAKPGDAADLEGYEAQAAPEPHLLVHARPGLVALRNPWADAPAVGAVASVSKYYEVPLVLWVEEVSSNGEWGRVELPYVWPRTEGWIPLKGLERETTWITVKVDLSEHSVRVFKRNELLYRVAGATGAPSSPTPPGEYFVTDRVAFSKGSYLGSFAFGISGIQPRLPAGWSGGNQLAIHGTNNPSSIGKSVSAGCVRVSEWALAKFKPLLSLGTPVLVQP